MIAASGTACGAANATAEVADVVDVCVVGAGPSGLMAATRLCATGRGALRVAIVEARDRVGGRCFQDHGAGYVDASHSAVHSACAAAGLPLYLVYDRGACFIESGPWGKREYRGADIPSGQSLRTVLALGRIINSIEVSTRKVVPDPENLSALDAAARELDRFSLLDYFRLRTSDAEALATLRLAILPVFGAEPEHISLLFFMFYCRAAGGLGRLITVSNGAQEARIAQGGFDELCQRLAAALPAGALRLGAPLVALRRAGDGTAELELATGRRLRARCVILAIQPSLWQRVACEPALPAAKLALSRAFQGTSRYAKARLRYESCWWRARGWSGQLVSLHGPATYFLDDAKLDGDAGLVAFIVDWSAAQAWRAAGEPGRRAALLTAQLRAALGDARAESELCGYKDWDWTADQWTDGCVPVLAPGALASGLVEARVPCWDGLLRFAGTETAGEGMGYVEGALRAGRRAAAEALDQLGLRAEASASRARDAAEKTVRPPSNSRGWLENALLGRRISAKALDERAARGGSSCTSPTSRAAMAL